MRRAAGDGQEGARGDARAARRRAEPREGRPRTHGLLFAIVVALCLAQVAWWIYFQVAEAGRLERAGELLLRGDAAAASRELGAGDASLAETARRRRVMFLSEGIALSVLVLVGVVFFYLGLVREQRLRAAQERFLTGTTHELKTPLASVRLGLESLAAGTLDAAKAPGYLQAMLHEVDRLERGLSNVLTAAGVRLAPQSALLEPGDLAQDVHASIEAVRVRATTAQVELRVGELPPTHALRDPDGVRRALVNVLDNAIKFSPPRSEVCVSLRHAGPRALLAIEDGGIGIGADDLPHVGERFYRGRNAVHRGGSGLGLFLARAAVRSSGGEMAVTSAGEGRGCRVEIVLPRRSP